MADGSTQSWTYFPDSRVARTDGRAESGGVSRNTTYAYEPAGGQVGATVFRPDRAPSGYTATFFLDGSPRSSTSDGASSAWSYDAIGSQAGQVETTASGTTSTETVPE